MHTCWTELGFKVRRLQTASYLERPSGPLLGAVAVDKDGLQDGPGVVNCRVSSPPPTPSPAAKRPRGTAGHRRPEEMVWLP